MFDVNIDFPTFILESKFLYFSYFLLFLSFFLCLIYSLSISFFFLSRFELPFDSNTSFSPSLAPLPFSPSTRATPLDNIGCVMRLMVLPFLFYLFFILFSFLFFSFLFFSFLFFSFLFFSFLFFSFLFFSFILFSFFLFYSVPLSSFSTGFYQERLVPMF